MAYGFCHVKDGTPVIGWEAIRPRINKLTKEAARRLMYREEALRCWHDADDVTERVMSGNTDVTWDDVKMIQVEAIRLENKALGK
jgi:hypothetical protein